MDTFTTEEMNGTATMNGSAGGVGGRRTGKRAGATDQPEPKTEHLTISAPKFEVGTFTIRGNAPLVVSRFGAKAMQQMADAMTGGAVAKNRKAKRPPKDFEAQYEDARHISTEGWDGYHAGGIRNALIRACSIAGYPMTRAKMSIFVEADGVDRDDNAPLVRINDAKPRRFDSAVRNSNGSADIRARPIYDAGWSMRVRIRYDAEQFAKVDVANLLSRAGVQCGLGCGRPSSTASAGCGWGTFDVE